MLAIGKPMAISLSVRTIRLSLGKIRKKQFFFEKKNQKTFVFLEFACGDGGGPSFGLEFIKVFWFFFSKKNCFLC